MNSAMDRKRTVIVGCGYLGSALGRALVSAGHHCIGTTTTETRVAEIAESGVMPAVVGLEDTEKLHELIVDREALFLAAAPNSAHPSYRQVYLDGARSVTRAVAGTRVQHIIYTSSTGVYGQQDGTWVDERSPTEPDTENGRILLETERVLLNCGEATDVIVTILRLGGIYGPGRDPAERMARRTVRERSDGDQYVNMIHQRDAVRAMETLLAKPYAGVLNLTDDRPTTRREFHDHLAVIAGVPSVRWLESAGSPRLGKRVRNELAKRVLDLTLDYPTHC